MDDTADLLEATPSSTASKKFDTEFTGSPSGELSMPICFLVKEQAKSHVAIQDLQKRVEAVENIQNDVIDSLAEIRKFLCADSKTLSTVRSLNASSEITSSKLFYSPSDAKRTNASGSKESASIAGYTPKQFDCKSKELALESDKQDSGLDSDQLSLNRHSLLSGKPESGDELLQLLEEISVRTEVLQKQLSDIEQKPPEVGLSRPTEMESSKMEMQDQDCVRPDEMSPGRSQVDAACACPKVEGMDKRGDSRNCAEGRSFASSLQKLEKKAASKIDSAVVSSILKETSVVDLQRQVLIYLVENAVLHTKVNELTHLLSSKSEERSKVENGLRDESRLLMMENRELRISLDEQKLETNCLRSKLLMMERVLSSVSFENRELTWQLGEFLGLQNASQKEPKLSSSYTYGDSKHGKRSSMPLKASSHSDSNLNCLKSRMPNNASSILDVTLEEPMEPSRHTFLSPSTGFDRLGGPVLSSTPMTHHTKLRDVKLGLSSVLHSNSSLHSARRCVNDDAASPAAIAENAARESSEEKLLEKNFRLSSSHLGEGTPKFPFNTILEKLKANSEIRLSRTSQEISTPEIPVRAGMRTKMAEEIVQPSEGHLLNSTIVQGKKGKNIHQRIQKILDRITSESEEPS